MNIFQIIIFIFSFFFFLYLIGVAITLCILLYSNHRNKDSKFECSDEQIVSCSINWIKYWCTFYIARSIIKAKLLSKSLEKRKKEDEGE